MIVIIEIGISIDKEEFFFKFLFRELEGSSCSEEFLFIVIFYADSEFFAIAKIFFYLVSQVSYKEKELCKTIVLYHIDLVLKVGSPIDFYHGLWDSFCNRSESSSETSCEDNYLHCFYFLE
jgi:hypothetical protein